MLIHEMESLLRNVDARLGRVEQILPTLALQEDLRTVQRDVQILTLDVRVLKEDVRVLKEDVQGLRSDVETSHRHLKVLYEDLKGDIRLLAEHLSSVMRQISDMAAVVQRLDRAR